MRVIAAPLNTSAYPGNLSVSLIHLYIRFCLELRELLFNIRHNFVIYDVIYGETSRGSKHRFKYVSNTASRVTSICHEI